MYVVCDCGDHILTLKKMECQCLYIVVCDSRDHIKMTEENDKLVKPFVEHEIYFTHSGSMYITHSFNVINIPPTPSFNVIDISNRNPSKVSKKRKRDSK